MVAQHVNSDTSSSIPPTVRRVSSGIHVLTFTTGITPKAGDIVSIKAEFSEYEHTAKIERHPRNGKLGIEILGHFIGLARLDVRAVCTNIELRVKAS